MQRLVVLALLLLACDPVDKIRVRFPVTPTVKINARWVRSYEGRAYADGRIYKGEWKTPEFDVTKHECCGVAHDYRNDDLRFIACIQREVGPAELVCGSPGDPPKLTHGVMSGSCDDLDGDIDVSFKTCAAVLNPAGAGSK